MAVADTEKLHERSAGLDMLTSPDVLGVLLDGQVAAVSAVAPAIPRIAEAAELAAKVVRGGGRLAYAAAGSSGLMALADGLELPGTYGIAHDRVAVLFAGGVAALARMAGGVEDDEAAAVADVAKAGIGAGDCIVAISASGTTPYTLAALRAARGRGARAIAIANNEDAPLLDGADVAILLRTPPEVIAGSTRMGAATAQKIALNLISTLMAIRLGHVHDGHMVNLQADNRKLKGRAARMVASIAGCPVEQAGDWLEAAGGSVKTAVMLAAGAPDRETAEGLLERAGWALRPALTMLEGSGENRKHGT